MAIKQLRAVVAGSIASALTQTILAGLGYWFAGLQSVFLLMALTALTGMVPFVGPTLIWIPVCAWLVFVEGRLMAGAGLAIGTAWGGLLTHFAAGVFMQVLRPYKVGDFVTAGGITGTVKELRAGMSPRS